MYAMLPGNFHRNTHDPVGFMRSVSAIVILDMDGTRLLAQYYDTETFPTLESQKAFEKKLTRRSCLQRSEIAFMDNLICLQKGYSDVRFYVVGSVHENELILRDVLYCLADLFQMMFKDALSRVSLLENLHACMILVDEVCDKGIVLETNPVAVTDRLRAGTVRNIDDMTLGELVEMAKEKFKSSILD